MFNYVSHYKKIVSLYKIKRKRYPRGRAKKNFIRNILFNKFKLIWGLGQLPVNNSLETYLLKNRLLDAPKAVRFFVDKGFVRVNGEVVENRHSPIKIGDVVTITPVEKLPLSVILPYLNNLYNKKNLTKFSIFKIKQNLLNLSKFPQQIKLRKYFITLIKKNKKNKILVSPILQKIIFNPNYNLFLNLLHKFYSLKKFRFPHSIKFQSILKNLECKQNLTKFIYLNKYLYNWKFNFKKHQNLLSATSQHNERVVFPIKKFFFHKSHKFIPTRRYLISKYKKYGLLGILKKIIKNQYSRKNKKIYRNLKKNYRQYNKNFKINNLQQSNYRKNSN